MSVEIKAPVFPESVADGTIATWHKNAGDFVKRDTLIVDVETDKVVLEVVAPEDGVLEKILKPTGEKVLSGEAIAIFSIGASSQKSETTSSMTTQAVATPSSQAMTQADSDSSDQLSPAVRKLIAEYSINPNSVEGTGKGGRLTKEDILNHIKRLDKSNLVSVTTGLSNTGLSNTGLSNTVHSSPSALNVSLATPAVSLNTVSSSVVSDQGDRPERRVPMTRIRSRIAERLLEVKQSTAMLTTFNEVNMKAVIDLRNKYKDKFEKVHGIKLGFMPFFIKAATEALKRFPEVNASIDGNDIVYHGYYDMSVAVSTERGLVVPVIRDADQKSLAALEAQIADFAQKARASKLSIEEMQGGTFTITNGGVFGSLLSTPIINSPQTAILGMHKTQERPMAVDGQVVILPMMYLALSYDHRLIDGKDAVSFLVTIKELLEDPSRMLLDMTYSRGLNYEFK